LSTQDLIDIQQLYATYVRAIDTGEDDGKMFASMFIPDGTFNAVTGRQAIAEFAKNFHETRGATLRHWNSNLLIRPTPEGASGSVYLMLLDVATKTVSSTGVYDDTIVRTSEGWRFKKRVVH